uniref:Heat shock 10 protein 1 n=1 Tax=Erpetoichthys calabaricus TaxID=27687 RepID=A0A8C4X5P7_ERPCA
IAKMAFRRFLPLFDQVLEENFAAWTKSQGKVLQAAVVAVGPETKTKTGQLEPVSVKVGDKVSLPEYGGTKVTIEEKEYFLFRDGDILGKYVD